MTETVKRKHKCMWKPKVGQRFMAYHLIGAGPGRHYHRCGPLVCTASTKVEVQAGVFRFRANWRFEPCGRKGKTQP